MVKHKCVHLYFVFFFVGRPLTRNKIHDFSIRPNLQPPKLPFTTWHHCLPPCCCLMPTPGGGGVIFILQKPFSPPRGWPATHGKQPQNTQKRGQTIHLSGLGILVQFRADLLTQGWRGFKPLRPGGPKTSQSLCSHPINPGILPRFPSRHLQRASHTHLGLLWRPVTVTHPGFV